MLLIDAANVIGSRPNGWWRDRAGAANDFVQRVRLAARSGQLPGPAVVVLEGAARRGVEEGFADGVRVLHAPRSGDDALLRLATETADRPVLVSADRALGRRIEEVGGDVVGPRWLLDRLEA
ncbi:MAG: hypothetical protein ACRDVW_05325 [Acidimicrobiales bacterium]